MALITVYLEPVTMKMKGIIKYSFYKTPAHKRLYSESARSNVTTLLSDLIEFIVDTEQPTAHLILTAKTTQML